MPELMDYSKVVKLLHKTVKKSRYYHSLNVVEMALSIAPRFSIDEESARYSAIYHDRYRNLSKRKILEACLHAKIKLEKVEIEKPMLLHGALASIRMEEELGYAPSAWKRAVRHHTLGSTEMGRLGAVLYIADYLEIGRIHISAKVRENILALDSLEQMVLAILDREKNYRLKKGKELPAVSLTLYKYLEEGNKFEN